MANYTAVFTAVANFNSAIREAGRLSKAYTDVRRQADKAGLGGVSMAGRIAAGAGSASRAASSVGKSMTLGLTAPIVALGAVGVRTFAKFETAIVSAGSKSDATAAQLERMKKVALDVGASTKFSATEAAVAMDQLAASGFNAEDAMKTLPAVTLAAQAANEDLGMTAETTAKIMNAFSIPTEKAGHVADVLTNSLNTTALSLQDVQDALGQVGEVGPRFNQSLEDVLAVTGRLVDMGVPAASAGTAIRQALTNLAAPSSAKAASLMRNLGLEVRDMNGEMRPLPDLIREVKEKIQDGNPALDKYKTLIGLNADELKDWAKQNGVTVTQAKQAQIAISQGGKAWEDYATQVLFGVEGAKAFSLAMSDGKPLIIDINTETEKLTRLTDGLAVKMGRDGAEAFVKAHIEGDKFVATSADAVESVSALNLASDGMAAKIGAAFQKTTAQKIDNFKGSIESLAIAFVQANQGGLNDIIDGLTRLVNGIRSFVEEHPKVTRFLAVFGGIVALLGPAIIIFGKLLGVIRLLAGAYTLTSKAIKDGIIWLKLYGDAAVVSGGKVKGGLLAPLASVAKFLKGPWGIALAAAALVLGLFIKKSVDAKKRLEEFKAGSKEYADVISQMTGEINRQTVAQDENTRSLVVQKLQTAGALDLAEKLGLSTQTVTDAVLGEQSAIDEVNRVISEGLAIGAGQTEADAARRNAAEELTKILGSQSKEEQEGIRLDRQRREATGQVAAAEDNRAAKVLESAEAQEALSAASKDLTTKTNALDAAVDEVSRSFSIMRGNTLSVQEASDGFEATLRTLRETVKKGSGSLKDNTEKGLENRAMLRDTIEALNQKITSNFQDGLTTDNVTEKTKKASEQLRVGRERLLDTAEAAGINRGAAKKMIDQMVLTPKELETQILTPGMKSALDDIKDLKKRIKELEDRLIDIDMKDRTFSVGNNIAIKFNSEILNRKTAGGGLIDGPGTTTSDSIMGLDRMTGAPTTWVSDKEFVVNARQTKKNLPILRAINDGMDMLAAGGMIGSKQRGSPQRGNLGAAGNPERNTIKANVPKSPSHFRKVGVFDDISESISKYIGEKVQAEATKQLEAKQAALTGAPGGSVGAYSASMAGVIAKLRAAGARSFTTYPGHHPSMAKARDVTPHNWALANIARAARSVWYVIYRMKIASKNHGNSWRTYHPSNHNGDWQHVRHFHVAWYGKGTNAAKRGPAVVGEGGPEVKYMSGGEKVKPLLQYMSEAEREYAKRPATAGMMRPIRLPAPTKSVASPRPITILIDLGDGLVQKVQGVIDDNDEFKAGIGRLR